MNTKAIQFTVKVSYTDKSRSPIYKKYTCLNDIEALGEATDEYLSHDDISNIEVVLAEIGLDKYSSYFGLDITTNELLFAPMLVDGSPELCAPDEKDLMIHNSKIRYGLLTCPASEEEIIGLNKIFGTEFEYNKFDFR